MEDTIVQIVQMKPIVTVVGNNRTADNDNLNAAMGAVWKKANDVTAPMIVQIIRMN
jgi:hypothetical protein